jgi:flagellar basal-body rod modification protein FlgD
VAISTISNQPATGLASVTAASATTNGTSSSTGTTNVSTNDFLQLLVAQMKSQDPLQPMDNTQFVTQLAQFSTLQTLQQIQSSLDSSMGAQLLGQAINLIGKSVTAQPSGAAAVSGTVQGVQLSGSDVILNLGSTTVHLSDIQQISEALPASSTADSGASSASTPISATDATSTAQVTPATRVATTTAATLTANAKTKTTTTGG